VLNDAARPFDWAGAAQNDYWGRYTDPKAHDILGAHVQNEVDGGHQGAAELRGHYRVVYWGCGSNCSAGALVDLETGHVFLYRWQSPTAEVGSAGWNAPRVLTGQTTSFMSIAE
jgi:hypothetical protein